MNNKINKYKKLFKVTSIKEMANLSTKRTGMSKGIIYISNRQGKHGPRIKYYRNNPGTSENSVISISKNPLVLKDSLKLTTKEINELVSFVKINYDILIKYWEKGETLLIDDVLDSIKKINMGKVKESSLSRVWKHVTEHDSGTISAFRYASDCGDGHIYSKSENKDRSRKLKAKLLSLGYSVTKIDGTYIENYGTKDAIEVREESWLVVDIKDSGNLKKDLIRLGTEFDQDSITYSKPSGDYYLISTNTCPTGYPGQGKIGVEVKLGKPLFGKDGEFHSKINGRPFVFESVENRLNNIKDYSISEIRSIKNL